MLGPMQTVERSCELLTEVMRKAAEALGILEGVMLGGYLAGDAGESILAAKSRAIELKAHAERALHAQERWLGRRT